MTTLNELAERCEKATGPDRELALSILCAVDPEHWTMGCNPSARDPTASLDAAMTLVPDGCEAIRQEQVRMTDGSIRCWASVGPVDAAMTRRCATPALALTAAALRARGSSHELR